MDTDYSDVLWHIAGCLESLNRPSNLLKPMISLDGNMWCALYGRDLMNGVCGFGKSPELAFRDFDIKWYEKYEVQQ